MGIIIKPLVTEKMTAITDKLNRFGFVVRPDANKLEIKKEVEALYNAVSYTHLDVYKRQRKYWYRSFYAQCTLWFYIICIGW